MAAYAVGTDTPYDIKQDTDRCSVAEPWAVIDKRTDQTKGCHPFEADAKKQAGDLYAKEGKNMQHLEMKAQTATVTDQGVFSALLSTYEVDRTNERVMPGAFTDTIEMWQGSGKRIPLHWEHSSQPENIIGYLDPKAMRETDDGLYVEGKLDLEQSSVAREVWRSMRNDAIGLSFGYLVQDEAQDGDVKQLNKLDLFEGTLTAKPVNAGTQVLSMKGMEEVLEVDYDEFSMKGIEEIFEQSPEESTILIVDPETLFVKASTAAWDGSASRFTDAQYARSCVLDRAKCGDVGDMPAKQRYSLPIREPGGALNANAVHAAAGRINQTSACAAAKASAKNALQRAYGELGEDAPDSIKGLTEDEARAELGYQEPEEHEPEVQELEPDPPQRHDELADQVRRENTEMRLNHVKVFDPRERRNEDFAVEEAALSTEDEDAGEELHDEKSVGQPRAQDPLADEVMREVTEMRLQHTRVFNPLEEE